MQDDVVSIAIEHLCQHAVEQWVAGTANGLEQPVLKRDNATISHHADGTQEPVYSHLRVPLEKLATSLALDLDSLIQQVSQMMETDLGQAADAFSREVLERHAPEKQLDESAGIATACSSVTRCMDQLLGCHQDDEETKRSRAGTLENALAVRRRRYALESSKTIRKWLIQQVEDSGNRVRGAQWAAQWIASQCQSVEQALLKLQGNICRELSVVQQSLQALQNVRGRGKDRERSARALAGLEQYIRLRLYEGVASSAICIIQVVKGQVANTQDELMDLERELRHLADQFDTSRAVDEPWGELEGPSNDLMQSVAQVICDNVERLTSGLAMQLEKELLQDSGGLGAMLLQGGRERNALPIVMRGIARTSIIGVMKQLDVSDILFHDDDDAQSEVDTLAECVQNARPRLIACGGAKRLLVMLPKGSSQVRPIEILHQQLGETPSVVGNCDGDFILCYEAEQISLTQAAVTIIDGRRDLADAASRLHTRNDIEWSSLPDLV